MKIGIVLKAVIWDANINTHEIQFKSWDVLKIS